MDNRPACYFYKRGSCRYGDRCRYGHDPSPPPAEAARKIIRAPKPRKPDLTLEIVPPAAPAENTRPSGYVNSSEYSIVGGPDRFAGLTRRATSPLLTRFPCAPGDIPPERRTYMLTQMKMRVISLVHGNQGGRATIELSECLVAWGFADQNKIDNLCICAMICSAQEFITEVLALS
jgi:hypothetical protein